jgi:hypothetical protein
MVNVDLERVQTVFILLNPLSHTAVPIGILAKDNPTCLNYIGLFKVSIHVLRRNSVWKKQVRAQLPQLFSPYSGGVVLGQVNAAYTNYSLGLQ